MEYLSLQGRVGEGGGGEEMERQVVTNTYQSQCCHKVWPSRREERRHHKKVGISSHGVCQPALYEEGEVEESGGEGGWELM